ncbi:hypothetical protein SAMN02983003_4044 [Devosia enhydra]|uniref:Uncharacterized protein n=1 Tax=Devosia enhydra TaxID=665118 RepID=A0A1K2I3C9_9HYPH|nr:hypothetical protein [Devosia enhydra]SFZ86849.1 hypothetical protein SAMN02983003_4044 [Devosia enhydra]
MSADGLSPTPPPSGARLGLQVLGALALGTVLTLTVVLPAEYGIDPTGFGALTGLNRISQPPEMVVETRFSAPPEIARPEALPFRQDVVTIPIGAFGRTLGATEYKVTLEEGQTLVYSWKASVPVVFEFHGHTTPTDGSPAQVMDYAKGTATEGNGALTAPLSGIHGWYFANPTFEDVSVELTLAGYYTLEPGLIGIH